MRCPHHLHQRLYANLLACLRHPIGLDLGTVTPEDTAFSITAEIVSVQRGGYGSIAAPDGHACPQDGARPERAAHSASIPTALSISTRPCEPVTLFGGCSGGSLTVDS